MYIKINLITSSQSFLQVHYYLYLIQENKFHPLNSKG